ncbi:MAG: F0F1 ATP synthase subunit alpha [Candidatus Enteromonas sp.]|jgi:F-type H+-transporting ATPase subunit alpha|nr:F0F1 ATP synthase subunit alpha [Bacilli bacterium]MEE3401525.1 F0F1 ATP synthase subunit alpha [Candidatus Enteromonas sp.]MBQ2052328.1 F0F1 ATP synthase subunit alpha [Bacilli bacterium]MBQ4182439.1 F0F1 ATP synthase subunit alpha [Bacilli bacterium]MEE3426278.1 F0F1 ATP synthase subunit alpha [Candidatus Enteromonas sp.]
MKIDSSEIASLIKAQIKGYEQELKEDDVGTVISVGDGIALCYGLNNAMLGELLIFPHDVYGMVMNLDTEDVGCVLLGSDYEILEGDTVKRTHKVVEVPVGDGLLGRVVNALGQPIDEMGKIEYSKTRPVERIAPGVMTRKSVDTPLETGIKAIDAMIPIGRGQRELIIGDRQTGKTAIALDAIINQKGKNVKCVYVAIGQKNSSVASIVEKLKEKQCMDYVTVVSSSASESAPLQYLAPFAGMAMAEEWMENGQDVLIVFDDLSKHAVAYRTLSLLLKRSPGREAYPGDIFYLHSRLLERACRLNKDYGGGSITALPIVETQAGDISAYIPTNIISITDGQIFLLVDYFNAGQRPAIDSGFSVSRVGSSAQVKAMKEVAKGLKIDLANYNEMLSFSQFGSDLDKETKKVLTHGKILMEVLKQKQYATCSMERQVIELYAVKNGFLDDLETKDVHPFLDGCYSAIKAKHPEIIASLVEKKAFDDATRDALKAAVADFKEGFKA